MAILNKEYRNQSIRNSAENPLCSSCFCNGKCLAQRDNYAHDCNVINNSDDGYFVWWDNEKEKLVYQSLVEKRNRAQML